MGIFRKFFKRSSEPPRNKSSRTESPQVESAPPVLPQIRRIKEAANPNWRSNSEMEHRVHIIGQFLQKDPDPEVRIFAIDIMSSIPEIEVSTYLLEAIINDKDSRVRFFSLLRLESILSAKSRPGITARTHYSDIQNGVVELRYCAEKMEDPELKKAAYEAARRLEKHLSNLSLE